MKRPVLILATLFLLVALFLGCAGDGSNLVDDMLAGDPDPPLDPCASPQSPTLTEIQAATFSPKCGVPGCHVDGGIGPMPLDTAEKSFDNLVDVASVEIPQLFRVIPGLPDDSYLVWKIEGNPNIVGVRMPFGGPMLPQDEIDAIRSWIDNGACP